VVIIATLAGLIVWLCTQLTRTLAGSLRSLASVVGAFLDGDYTIRARRGRRGDALGDLANEINDLGDGLHAQRLHAIEANALLDNLIRAIDVAVLVFDGDRKLRLINPAASRLLRVDAAGAITAADLGLGEFLSDEAGTRITTSLGERAGRWQVTHGIFREGGRAQHLLIVADVLQALREEERAAWQRLIRVIGHEVNNSLTPIKSLADTLQDLIGELPATTPSRADALNALRMIGERSDSLARFLSRYSQLARLPPLRPMWQPLAPLLERVVALNRPHAISIRAPEALEVFVDEDQLEQALINLAKNAIEANGDGAGNVSIIARVHATDLQILVTDEGPGVANAENLFVPLFTTKPGGSGIGLVLSRKIAEAHGGTLQLRNRRDVQHGAVATLELPRAARTG
jgi:nitrogen fixation/metabolism regulation signal transduction histidine kinase